jgi:MraZ protein
MKIFVSTYYSKIDDKGRVSIPAAFRHVVEQKGEMLVYGYNSLNNECIELCTPDRILQIQGMIEALDVFSQERDLLAVTVLGASEALGIDAKGRIVLPERLINFAALEKEVAFVGKGTTFEIWDRQKFNQYFADARAIVKKNGLILKPHTNGGAHG